jgi:hypothetical protein
MADLVTWFVPILANPAMLKNVPMPTSHERRRFFRTYSIRLRQAVESHDLA